MTAAASSLAPGPRFGRRDAAAVAAAGLAGAVVEMAVVIPIQAQLGNSVARVFQTISAGAIGRAAFASGAPGVAFGLAVHLLVSLAAALVYVEAALRWPPLDRRPVAGGILFGAAAYVFMTWIVIPLSAIGLHPPRSLVLMAASIAIHLFAFGLPIALVSHLVRHGRLRS